MTPPDSVTGQQPSLSGRTRVVLTILLACVVVLGQQRVLDSLAERPIDASFSRALATYAVIRGLNAVISVAQGTEVDVAPAGVGVTFTPGEVLDPVNDLIERFSWIVLAASTSLGAQKVLVQIGATPAALVATLIAVASLVALLWWKDLIPRAARLTIYRLSVFLLLLRFAVPVIVVANEAVYSAFLVSQYDSASAALNEARNQVEALQQAENSEVALEEPNLLNRFGQFVNRTSQSLNVNERMAEYESRLADASESIINLIVVFVLQTIVFPLLFLWIALRAVRFVFQMEI